ncbi:hypothetical protein [Oerskovia sp. KBS0722]|uniref:hypothetical protein n=1 Tax=Oerskovia sp. KBS0722 TaxID=1179673 RepID=UPI00110E0377|nr:hypothetical protein [Oerskovia sp. KBS0722]QDW62902.1 hypothetical protein FFI11_010500 [Oerskovia sp. KBS0722]
MRENERVREETRRVDSLGLWLYSSPRAPLARTCIDSLERSIGYALDPDCESFLRCADGWPAFYQSVTLFGSVELDGGSALLRARGLLSLLPEGVLKSIMLGGDGLSMVAAAEADMDLFVMPLAAGAQVPPVIWLAGGEVERFASFRGFFEAMIEYSRADLADLADRGRE